MKPEDFAIDRDLTAKPLSQEEQEFLTANSDNLTEEQAEHYGIEKAAAPYVPQAPKTPKEPKPGEGGDDDEDFDEEDEKKFGKLFDKKVAPIIKQTTEQARVMSVNNYIQSISSDIPTAGKYKDAMLQTMAIPGYGHMKPEEVFRIVAGNELMRIGAKKEREAQARANGTMNRGSAPARPSNPAGGGKDWSKASAEEIAQKKAEVLGRPS